jgi:tetratricopeptide (TPR) repeat protein
VLAPKEAYPKGKAAALKALEWDRSLAEAHASLGVVKRDFEWDWPGAEQEFQRAIELNPGCVEAYHWRGTLLCMLGRHTEGLREKNNALALDPLSVVVRSDLARMYYYARDYHQALEHFRAALAMDPDFWFAHLRLAQVYEQLGMLERAESALEEALRRCGESPFALAKSGHHLALSGRTEEARRVIERLDELAKQRYVSPYDIAMIHVGLQEMDTAFYFLEKAFEERSVWLGYLGLEPQWDPLRTDPRFNNLLRRVNLPSVHS